mgnify:CR=1 FL=1
MGFNPLEEIGKAANGAAQAAGEAAKAVAQQRKRLAMVPMRLQKPWAKVRSKL